MKSSLLIVAVAIVGLSGCAAANVMPSSTATAATLPTAAGQVSACASPGTGPASAVAASDAPRRRIFLMRHGEANYFDAHGQRIASPDLAVLTDRGHDQARAAAQWFCAMGVRHFDRVITSDLPRAEETARDLLDTMGLHGIQPQSWPEFREMTAFGQARVAAGERLQGGESVGEARARILPALDKLRREQWDTALIIVHTLVNQVILSEALTGGDEIYGRIEQGTGCINILDVGPGSDEWVVRAVNVCPDTSAYWSRQSVLDRLRH